MFRWLLIIALVSSADAADFFQKRDYSLLLRSAQILLVCLQQPEVMAAEIVRVEVMPDGSCVPAGDHVSDTAVLSVMGPVNELTKDTEQWIAHLRTLMQGR